ncbi:hypothetical protein FQN54_001962 [Arachnomyces sp. PD_36]|nr:hypothetical protein FQN54_001962 [Arachnomyces sp. PD_36]
MGCCISRSSSDSPYSSGATEQHHADSSSRAINPNAPPSSSERPGIYPSRTPSHSNISSARNSGSIHRSRRRPHLPLTEHYNRPIQPHIWRSKNRLWSRAELARERKEFFETRVTGRAEVWAALGVATELLRGGDTTTAQGIVDAAGVTVPTGDMCDGCYDENGALYRLPEVVVMDPSNVVDDDDVEIDSAAHRISSETTTGVGEDVISDGKVPAVDSDEVYEGEEELERRREEKGKAIERDLIKVKARLSDRGGPDVTIVIGKNSSVGALVRRVQTEAGVQGKYRIRIAYLGKVLSESQSLLDQGWQEGHIVNALVVMKASTSTS